MAYDEYRERHRFELDDELRGEDRPWRREFRSASETRWPGESSWGYGREYDEGPTASSRARDFAIRERFEREETPRYARSQSEIAYRRPERHHPRFSGEPLGWRPQSGSIHLYGAAQGTGLSEPGTWGTLRSPGMSSYYGVSSHLAGIPRGRFTGRGPKGYQRSDERIREDVSEELAQSGEIDASEIEVVVTACEVTLSGEVNTREEKRLAEDIAEAAPGVREVHNQLKVRKGFFARLFGTDDEEEREASYSARESR